MLFNSLHFLLFLPIVISIYYIIKDKYRYIWLLLSSYYFYMCWNPKYALLIFLSTLVTYFSAKLIRKSNLIKDKDRAKRQKRLWVFLSFAINIGILIFFKYSNFIVDNLNILFSSINFEFNISNFDILLPVGISFYTFQALSYTMDSYRGDVKVEKNFAKYALFVSFFPQLVAGPIERSKDLLAQISLKHKFDYNRVKDGILLILYGFFLKVVVADRVAILVNNVYDDVFLYKGLELIIATVFFAIQIYCDFLAYSTIAKGSARILGYELTDNFNRPYFSTSIKDFWRRWHISLSNWFRDYLFIPLGGSRVSKIKKYRNILIVFLISGLWHGASWTFIIWGFLHGVYQVIGDLIKPLKDRLYNFLFKDRFLKVRNIFKIITTFILVDFAWIFFRANNLKEVFYIIKNMFVSISFKNIFDLGLDKFDFCMALLTIFILFLIELLSNKISYTKLLNKLNIILRWLIYLVIIFFILIFGIYGPGYDSAQFIYFQF